MLGDGDVYILQVVCPGADYFYVVFFDHWVEGGMRDEG